MLSVFLISQPTNNLISDYDFTNQNFTYEQTEKFVKSFTRCILSDSHIRVIYNDAKKYTINILVVLTKLEQENSIVINSLGTNNINKRLSRCMAAGLAVKKVDPVTGKKRCPYIGFEIQMDLGCKILRKHFDAWEPGTQKHLHFGETDEGVITPVNAATHSLYMYTPIYGRYLNDKV